MLFLSSQCHEVKIHVPWISINCGIVQAVWGGYEVEHLGTIHYQSHQVPPSVSSECLGEHSADTWQALGRHSVDTLGGHSVALGGIGGLKVYLKSNRTQDPTEDPWSWPQRWHLVYPASRGPWASLVCMFSRSKSCNKNEPFLSTVESCFIFILCLSFFIIKFTMFQPKCKNKAELILFDLCHLFCKHLPINVTLQTF